MLNEKKYFVASLAISTICTMSVNWTAYASDLAVVSSPDTAPHNDNLQARGVLIAGQSADIAAGMSGKLLKAPYKTGQFVKSGAVLAQFDCTQQQAELDARKAAHATQSLRYENQNELLTLGAAGELDVSIARSERDQLHAEMHTIKVAMQNCTITAPFSGYVTQRHVNAFETPQSGQAIYSFMRASRTELSVIAPSRWVKWLGAGQKLSFIVDETGETFQASILRLSAQVDPVSQTIEISAKPVGKIAARPGMSGVARFTQPN